jgi:hypothetical protein
MVINEVVDLAKRSLPKKKIVSVSWSLLDYMLVRFGFGDKWQGVDEDLCFLEKFIGPCE